MLLSALLPLTALLAVAAPAPVTHDPAACPILTGTYELFDPLLPPLKVKITSFKNDKGTPAMTIVIIDPVKGDRKDEILLDGVKTPVGDTEATRGSCSGDVAFVDEYEDDVITRRTRLSLDVGRDLSWEIEEEGEAPSTQLGVRQSEQ